MEFKLISENEHIFTQRKRERISKSSLITTPPSLSIRILQRISHFVFLRACEGNGKDVISTIGIPCAVLTGGTVQISCPETTFVLTL